MAGANESGPSEPGPTARRSGQWRLQHRARAHESAHAQGAGAEAPTRPPEHPLIPKGNASIVSTNEALSKLAEELRGDGRFAYDSEFIGELTYVPKLCLIQVASPQRIALIDPLAEGLELGPFWDLLSDPAVEKTVHAGQQDVEPVYRHSGKPPANIFDTQIAAGFIGLAYPVSLGKLVEELVRVRLGKGLTLTHWDQRPLSTMQLRYAADDVRYLPAVREELARRLEATGHASWAKEECQAMCDGALSRFDPQSQYLRLRGAGSLSARGLAILRELTIWRDGAARAHDVPPRTLVRDEVLVDLARSPADSVAKLAKIRGLPRPVEQTHGAEIVQSIRQAMTLGESELPTPRQAEDGPSARFAADALWAAVQCLAVGQGIDPGLVCSRQETGELYRALMSPKSGERELSGDDFRILHGWRREAVGEPLLELVRGRGEVTLSWMGDRLRASTARRGASS